MSNIAIHNIGPIRHVSFELNKLNVFIGPQSSGKSTIAKIVSFCSWYEKNVILHPSNRPAFFEELISFHNLEPSYFSEDSYVEYQSDYCKFKFVWDDEKNSSLEILAGSDNVFHNRKISYIPAERNFVTLQGLGKYNETRDNIMSFLYEWFLAKKKLTSKTAYEIPLRGLGVKSFYYDKESDSDRVNISSEQYLSLNHSSSGLRSCIPMLVVLNYTLKDIFTYRRTPTPFEIMEIEERLKLLKQQSTAATDAAQPQPEDLAKILGYDSDYAFSMVIIEEPELNLFPTAQQDFVYHTLAALNETQRPHQLLITTHSPYILFAINNCILGGLVGKEVPLEIKRVLASGKSWIDPRQVSVYEIHDGSIRCIQDEDGIIEDNYLNQAYKTNSAEYLSLLNYYDDET